MRSSGGTSWTWLRAVVATVLVGSALVVNPGGAASETGAADDAATELHPELAFAQQVLDVAQNPDVDPSQRAIDTARMALDHRHGQVDAELLPLLDQQARNLNTAEELLALGDPEDGDPLEYGIAAAKVATDHQAATLGLDLASVGVDTPDHGSPSEAALALVEHEGGSVTDSQFAELQTLDQLPEPAQVALTDFIDAFIGFSIATDLAYADADMERIEALLEVMDDPEAVLELVGSVQPRELLTDLGVDFTPVFAARNALLDTVESLRDALLDPEVQQQQSAAAPIQVAPVFSIELGTVANTYSQDFMLLIDVGGDDTYLNNAGGALVIARSAAALVDLLGNDQYRSGRSSGINGGGSIASGFLIDALGNDQYTAGGSGTNGGGNVGTGLLLDALGADAYSAGANATNGGGQIGGVGLLVDVLSSDEFTATSDGVNGGGNLGGVGFLFDLLSGNTFSATSRGTNGGGHFGGVGFLQGGCCATRDTYSAGSAGVNGGGGGLDLSNLIVPTTGGVGFLFDVGTASNDLFQAASRGTNGGGDGGVGLLLDAGGSDSYTAGSDGVNGGGNIGTGTLIDIAGADTYSAGDTGVNGGAGVGTGLLLDATGSDIFFSSASTGTLGWRSTNGGGNAGAAALIDGSGNDRYTGANGNAFLGTGLLFDAGGTDRYRPDSSTTFVFDQTVVPKGDLGVGAQIDAPIVPVPPTTLPTLPPTTLPVPTTLPTLPPTTLPTVTTSTPPPPTLPTTTTSTLPPAEVREIVVTGDAVVEPGPVTFDIRARSTLGEVTGTFSTDDTPLLPGSGLYAEAGTDYVPVAGVPITLNEANGFHAQVTVDVLDDDLVELPEIVKGDFSADPATGNPSHTTSISGLGVILDDDTDTSSTSTSSSSTTTSTTTSSTTTTTTVPPPPPNEFPSDDCDDAAGGTAVVDGFAGDAYTKVRTAPGGEPGATLVCVALEAGGLHLGGSLSVEGAATPSLDTDFAACDQQADQADLHHERAPAVLGQELFHLDVNLMGDELWICARLADDPSTDRRVVITVDPASLPDLDPALDPLEPHDPAYPSTPPTDPALASSACQGAASGDVTRVVDAEASGSHVWLHAWQESATRSHVCVRAEGADDAGGRLTVDGNGDQTVVTTSTDTAPCDVNVITDHGGPGPVPGYSITVSDPGSGVPTSVCVTVGTGVAQRVTVDAGDQTVVTWTPDA